MPAKPPVIKPWTTTEDDRLLREKNVNGRLWTAIGDLLGRDPESCKDHYLTLMHGRLTGKGRPVKTRVKCLGPLSPSPHYFMSPDKSRYRLCPACRAWNAEQQPQLISIMDDIDTTLTSESVEEDKEPKSTNNNPDVPANEDEQIWQEDQYQTPVTPNDTVIAVDVYGRIVGKSYSE